MSNNTSNIEAMLEKTAKAATELVTLNENVINALLFKLADEVELAIPMLLEANLHDLAKKSSDEPTYDRLKLTAERIKSIASDIRSVAELPSPLDRELEQRILPNGLLLRKVAVPIGVVGVIYEARPNVTFDVFTLCLKSGNGVILKGGSDAYNSNSAAVEVIKGVLGKFEIDENTVNLLPPDRASTLQMLKANRYIDVVIPRGSGALIRYVRENSTIPVIETGAGICHTYFEKSGDKHKGQAIVTNAKTRRVSVCNALDCLIVDEERINDLPFICEELAEHGVELYADEDSFEILETSYPPQLLKEATDESYGTEFLSYKMAIKTVGSFAEALAHIAKYSSKHSEAIISEDRQRIDLFFKMVDAAAVYANASTAFTDGAQFGLGAEIGISTQKLHARGPMALVELTSYKWLITGNGQIRPS